MRLDQYRIPEAGGEAPADEAASSMDPLKACMRFVDGSPTKEDIEWVGRAFNSLLSNMGEVPLERHLHLPNSFTAWRKSSRDEWLRKAASLLEASSGWRAAQKLEAEWGKFIQRGAWQQWRHEEHPPEHLSALNRALFYATKLNKSRSLDAKQLSRIVGHAFIAKSL